MIAHVSPPPTHVPHTSVLRIAMARSSKWCTICKKSARTSSSDSTFCRMSSPNILDFLFPLFCFRLSNTVGIPATTAAVMGGLLSERVAFFLKSTKVSSNDVLLCSAPVSEAMLRLRVRCLLLCPSSGMHSRLLFWLLVVVDCSCAASCACANAALFASSCSCLAASSSRSWRIIWRTSACTSAHANYINQKKCELTDIMYIYIHIN